MAKKPTDSAEQSAEPQVKVRVAGKQPIAEAGKTYFPACDGKTAGEPKREADTFEVAASRAAALGDLVEVLG